VKMDHAIEEFPIVQELDMGIEVNEWGRKRKTASNVPLLWKRWTILGSLRLTLATATNHHDIPLQTIPWLYDKKGLWKTSPEVQPPTTPCIVEKIKDMLENHICNMTSMIFQHNLSIRQELIVQR
jgi:hypothetical protein